MSVPAARKPEFMWRLREMNVSAASLFPDADGFGRSLKEAAQMSNERLNKKGSLGQFLIGRRIRPS
jgi:hypothetical protein